MSKFEDAFSGEGQLEEKLHLKIDESVCTTSGTCTSGEESPLCTEGSLKTRTRVVGIKKGISQPVDVHVPTDRVSLMVVVKKSNGKVRL